MPWLEQSTQWNAETGSIAVHFGSSHSDHAFQRPDLSIVADLPVFFEVLSEISIRGI